jgi:hypothetical protein
MKRYKVTLHRKFGRPPLFLEADDLETHIRVVRQGDRHWERAPEWYFVGSMTLRKDQVVSIEEDPPDWPILDPEHLVCLSLGFVPEAAVSGASLLQDESGAFLIFNATRQTEDGRREEAGTAVVEFKRCIATRFGMPNDEALQGHPLYPKGLKAYGCFEVIGSTWKKRLELDDQLAFPDFEGWDVRHFAFTFHDSSFECLSETISAKLRQEPRSVILAELFERLSAPVRAEDTGAVPS